jgi:CBS domain-containing protein
MEIGSSLRDALSLMLTEGVTQLVVRDETGKPVGTVSLEAIASLVAEDRNTTPA